MAEPVRVTHNELERFIVIYVVAFVVAGLISPYLDIAALAGGALVGSVVAWLFVRRRPDSIWWALLRGASIVVIIGGFQALGSDPEGKHTLYHERLSDTFLLIGFAGLLCSFLGVRLRD